MHRQFGMTHLFQRVAICILVCGIGSISDAFADEPSARKILDATKKLLDEAETAAAVPRLGFLEQARKNLKLIPVELVDVEGAAKTKLEQEVKTIEGRVTSLAASGETKDAIDLIDSLMAAAKESLGNPDTLERHLKQVEQSLKNDGTRKALGDAKFTTITKQIAALRAASVAQQRDAAIAQLKESLPRIEADLPETLKELESDAPAARDAAIRRFQGRDYQLVEKILEWMPADDAEAKPLIVRF